MDKQKMDRKSKSKDEKHGMCDLNLTRSICGVIFVTLKLF